MFYVIDRMGRIIIQSESLDTVKSMAIRIASAGAWCAVATDSEAVIEGSGEWTRLKPKKMSQIGKSEAWRLENDPSDGKETPANELEKIVGPIGDEDEQA